MTTPARILAVAPGTTCFRGSPKDESHPMERMFTVETTLDGGLAELYAQILEEFEARSENPAIGGKPNAFSDRNHSTSDHDARGWGLIEAEKAESLERMIKEGGW